MFPQFRSNFNFGLRVGYPLPVYAQLAFLRRLVFKLRRLVFKLSITLPPKNYFHSTFYWQKKEFLQLQSYTSVSAFGHMQIDVWFGFGFLSELFAYQATGPISKAPYGRRERLRPARHAITTPSEAPSLMSCLTLWQPSHSYPA